MIYLAHSKKGNIPEQEYSAHIRGVSSLAREYVRDMVSYSKYDKALLSQVVEKASAYHDMGKLNRDNQDVLSGKISSKSLPRNHVDAGAAHFLNDKYFFAVSAAAIQAHHIGFPDFSAEMNKGDAIFRDVSIASDVDRELPELEAIHDKLIESHFKYAEEEINGNRSVFFRMLLSCIADADHTNTAINYHKYPINAKTIPLRPAERLKQLDRRVAELQLKGANDERNALRNEMYHACRDVDIDSDISSCDSPVGSGKTTAVMAHLLALAEKRGLRRIFVVLPFTNIIKQSVETYRDMLVLPGENADEVVAELHHRADFESEDTRYLTALWRAPIIVTTAVAFFETLASNSTATLRRLHELPGSAIFVDEAHAALPASLLPIAWKWINIYATEWNCYWVLASGSLNRFWTIPKISDANNSNSVPEIIDDELRNRLSVYENRRISYHSDLCPKGTTELADWIVGFPGPRLVIMNTVQSAAVLADFFAENFGRECVEHLSTALTSNYREDTLNRVIKRLKNKEDTDWTLVATSCVEAGVNLSFRNGFRELGSLVSLLQASGRVNREGIHGDSEMWTFCISEDGMIKLNPGLKQSAAVLKGYFERNRTIEPELSTQSISDEIALYGLSGKHKKLISAEEVQNFPQVEHDFKVIDTDTRLVVVDSTVADRLQYGKVDWRELQKVSVQIAKYKLDELRTPMIMDNVYRWNLDYDDFLGYMAGIVKLKKYSGGVIII
ncbi:CRISPR-associated helicase Cas3 [Desulfosporosinus sp. I2]|uniref:CRISPR-associated helicase/endonuclease Cas3 n=1 Tax=Desulfosporosinus sp. I2 TaxID=1617025 RepID=UPI0005EDC9C3|nr:DEAD/DEAH box helicase [Desulfosporosinus sp. I2]KJR44588.1 CRISPR-associated helicase Cas3 [Desulfosporosinus sp. I2]